MDEWLSVGDASFVAKAEERMQSFVGRSSIMVLASHNPKIISELCNVKITLEHGAINAIERFERPAGVSASVA
jgi:lipopolysaccharide transport system ATP-binding protein